MAAIKILICGLPGSGKTTLARALQEYFIANMHSADWFNADSLRAQFNDWDFTVQGRLRQATRMAEHCLHSTATYALCDFVAPLPESHQILSANWTIFVNTVSTSQYHDTNTIFQAPAHYDFLVTEKDASRYAALIGKQILSKSVISKFDP